MNEVAEEAKQVPYEVSHPRAGGRSTHHRRQRGGEPPRLLSRAAARSAVGLALNGRTTHQIAGPCGQMAAALKAAPARALAWPLHSLPCIRRTLLARRPRPLLPSLLQVLEDPATGNVKVKCPSTGKAFAPEEISAQVRGDWSAWVPVMGRRSRGQSNPVTTGVALFTVEGMPSTSTLHGCRSCSAPPQPELALTSTYLT
jgi:hypothetical protein